LARPVSVHRAPALVVKKDTVTVFLFDEADILPSQGARVVLPKLGLGETQTSSQHRNLLIGDANRTGRSSAAVPAPQALEAESVFVPELTTHEMMPLFHAEGRPKY